MNNIAVITSIFGGKDNLREIKEKVDGIDYFCFSDQDFLSETWKVVKRDGFSNRDNYTSRVNAKVYRILPFIFLPDYNYYVWVDGNHSPKNNILRLIAEMENQEKEFAFFAHNERNCVYDEIEACRNIRVDVSYLLDKQKDFYQKQNYPIKNGLFETPGFAFKKTSKTINLMLSWWEQINMFSSRDQISLPFCLWKANIEPMIIPGIVNGPNQNNEYFIDHGSHNY